MRLLVQSFYLYATFLARMDQLTSRTFMAFRRFSFYLRRNIAPLSDESGAMFPVDHTKKVEDFS